MELSEEEKEWEVIPSLTKVSFAETSSSSSSLGNDPTPDSIPRDIDWDHFLCPFRADFGASVYGRVAQNAATATSVKSITQSRNLVQSQQSPFFSINLDRGGMPVTNQQNSGRCWMFGFLNLLRFNIRDNLVLDDFEFSEAFLLFYYLLEQVNFVLECIIATSDLSLDDRLVQQFIGDVIDDGGDWQIAVNLVQKYGLVPKDVFPESYSSSDTEEMNAYLNKMWRDSDGAFHRLHQCTPKEFVQQNVTVPFHEYVPLIQDPRNEYYKRFEVAYSMPMCGGHAIVFLNVPADDMKTTCLAILKVGQPVFFACTVENELSDEYGLWDSHLYENEEFYGISVSKLNKADKIRMGCGMGDHVMLFTGVDIDADGTPRRWRVENSWGAEDAGHDGYYYMDDNWFEENVFEIVVPPKFLSPAAKEGLSSEIHTLPAWDPMEMTRRRSSLRKKNSPPKKSRKSS